MTTTTTPKPLGIDSGCKVGWEIYATKEDAEANVARVVAAAQRRYEQGYDFGYCVPGEVRYAAVYYRAGDSKHEPSYVDVWVLTTS